MAHPRVQFPAGQSVPRIEELLAQESKFEVERGVAPAYAAEVEKAKQIVGKVPTKMNPFEVAQFFQELRQGEHEQALGPDAHLYAEEWPVRANPLIVEFFNATTLRSPNGDQTAWCAAFVNWCILQGRKGRDDEPKLLKHTASAASETFRKWGTRTDKPIPGDIVVFRHKRESWRGHVGFLVSRSKEGVYVLGGNQMPLNQRLPDGTYERHNTGEINIKRMPVDGRDLELHSFQTDPSLHDL
jgi:uncharacterized protein (TIGR02594 family)